MISNFTLFENLSSEIPEIPPDSIISRTIYSDEQVKVVLFGFAQGQELSEHTASQTGPAFLRAGGSALDLWRRPNGGSPGDLGAHAAAAPAQRLRQDTADNAPGATKRISPEIMQNRSRFPLIALSPLLFLTAIWAGLVRLGWRWPPLQPTLPLAHGPLMVSGFLGTLIALERAVALRSHWTYIGPILTGLGGLSLDVGIGGELGPILIALGSLGLLLVFAVIVRRHFALYTVVMALGALFCLALKRFKPIIAPADRVLEALSFRCGETWMAWRLSKEEDEI